MQSASYSPSDSGSDNRLNIKSDSFAAQQKISIAGMNATMSSMDKSQDVTLKVPDKKTARDSGLITVDICTA